MERFCSTKFQIAFRIKRPSLLLKKKEAIHQPMHRPISINDKLGTTTQKRDVEIIYVKNNKGEYDDLENAMLDAKQGYDMLVSRPDDAKGKLQSAIDAWEAALAEGDMDDKKARINKKVVPDLYKNLILAYSLIGEFDKADDHYNDSLRMGFNNGDENDLKEINLLTADLRERYQK